MSPDHQPAEPVLSSRISQLILSSTRLKQLLLPEGLVSSPYAIQSYDATLVLMDPDGTKAIFARMQQIQFLQQGVAGLLDHFWGDGLTITDYQNTAGQIKDSFRDQGKRHLVLRLPRAMQRGEKLEFAVARQAMEAFRGDNEWIETSFDQPVGRLTQTIIFPAERPCRRAVLLSNGMEEPLLIRELPGGKSLVHVEIAQAKPNVSYLIRWSW